MADRIKTVSTYNGTSWGSEVPIGADASNVDVTLSNNTKSELQTVLGSTPSGSSVTERINSKVSTSGGDVADTVVSKNISNYDSSTDAGDNILTDTAATMSTNTSTLWSRFNLFRKKVSNNFENYFAKSSLVGSDVGVTSTGDDNTAYTTAAINDYLSNVIGYTSASAPEAGDVATQLSTLNSNTLSISDSVEKLSNVYADKKLRIYNASYSNQSYNVAAYSGQTKSYTIVWPSNYIYLGAINATCSGVIGIMVKLDDTRPNGPMNTTIGVWIQNIGPNARSGSNLSIAISCLVLVDY